MFWKENTGTINKSLTPKFKQGQENSALTGGDRLRADQGRDILGRFCLTSP